MILVVGATGVLGGMTTLQLLKDGKSVRALVRENSPATALAAQGQATDPAALVAAGAETVTGDLKDPASLDAACAGIDIVITTANAAVRGGEDTFESVDLNGTLALIDAAKRAGVRHFIYTSAAGSDPHHPHPLYSAKGHCEATLKESGMTYTILKPGVFMEIWIGAIVGAPLGAGGPVTLVGQGDRQQAFVSIADVAAYAVAAVDHPAAKNREIFIAGPQSHSWNDAVAAVGAAIGQELPVAYIAPGEPLPLVPALGPMLTAMEQSDNVIDMAETAATFGIKPTSLQSFAARFFGQPVS
jgi:NADH dehydrogenase